MCAWTHGPCRQQSIKSLSYNGRSTSQISPKTIRVRLVRDKGPLSRYGDAKNCRIKTGRRSMSGATDLEPHRELGVPPAADGIKGHYPSGLQLARPTRPFSPVSSPESFPNLHATQSPWEVCLALPQPPTRSHPLRRLRTPVWGVQGVTRRVGHGCDWYEYEPWSPAWHGQVASCQGTGSRVSQDAVIAPKLGIRLRSTGSADQARQAPVRAGDGASQCFATVPRTELGSWSCQMVVAIDR